MSSSALASLPWEEWADGRPWRLKDGKHFPADPKEAVAAAEQAAARMGKAVRTLTDIQPPHAYVWVQFADEELAPGAPCTCGSRTLVRLHPSFVRCPECGRTAILVARKAGRPANPLSTLDGYTDVTIFDVRRSSDDRKELEFGHALDERGRRMLIVVTYALHAGDRIPDPAKVGRDPDDPASYVHTVKWWNVEPFAAGIDLEALERRAQDDERP